MKLTLRILGFLFCVLPPALVVLDQYPLMTTSARLSGLAVILLVLCAVPLWRHLKELLKSPSAWLMWGIVLLFCLVVKAVLEELTLVAMIAFPSSVIGAVLFYLAKKVEAKQ